MHTVIWLGMNWDSQTATLHLSRNNHCRVLPKVSQALATWNITYRQWESLLGSLNYVAQVLLMDHISLLPLLQGQPSLSVMGSRLVGSFSYLPLSISPVVARSDSTHPTSIMDMAPLQSSLLSEMHPRMDGTFRHYLAFKLRAGGSLPGFICTSMPRSFWFCCCFLKKILSIWVTSFCFQMIRRLSRASNIKSPLCPISSCQFWRFSLHLHTVAGFACQLSTYRADKMCGWKFCSGSPNRQ